MSLEEMIDAVKKQVLFDYEIKDSRITRWTSVTFDQFRKTTECEEKSARKVLAFVMKCQRDISKQLLAKEHLYTCIKSIFRSVTWCEILYQRTDAHETAT